MLCWAIMDEAFHRMPDWDRNHDFDHPDHRDIVEALRSRDPDKAEAVARVAVVLDPDFPGRIPETTERSFLL